jgi:hypothetical protein
MPSAASLANLLRGSKPRKVSPEKHHAARAMFLQGVGYKVIASKIGIPAATVRTWMIREKWGAARAEAKERFIARMDESMVNAAADAVNAHQSKVADVASNLLDRVRGSQARKPEELVRLASTLRTVDDVARRNLGLSTQESATQQFSFHMRADAGIERMPEKVVQQVEAEVVPVKAE